MHNVLIITLISTFSLLATTSTYAQTSTAIEIDECLHNADSLRRRDNYPSALIQLEMISGLELQMNATQLAEYYKLRGDAQFTFGKYPDALKYFSKSKTELKKLNTPESKVNYANIFTLNGIVFKQMGEYEKAKDIFLEGLIYAESLPTKDRNRAVKYMYTNLGESYELLGRYDEAVKTNFHALDLIAELGQEISRGAGVAHNNLGISYKKLGRFELSKKHFEIAAKIYTEAFGPDSRPALMAQESAALALEKHGDSEKAIPFIIKKIEYYKKIPGADLIDIANTYSTLGETYNRIGDHAKSIAAFEQSIATLRSMKSYKKDLEIRLLRRLAGVEIVQEAIDSARKHLDEAFEIQNSTQSLAPADLVELHSTNALFYLATDQQEELFSSLKKANDLSLSDTSNQIRNIISIKPQYIKALISRNELALAQREINSSELFIKSNKDRIFHANIVQFSASLDALRAQLACARGSIEQAFADGLDEKLEAHAKTLIEATASTSGKKNQRYNCSTCFNVGDILGALANIHLEAYQKGISTDDNHLEKALVALDIKQSYLTNIWRNEHFSGLPIEQKNIAKEIRQRISAYDLLIFENNAGTPAAQKQNSLYRDSIQTLRPQLEQFISQLDPKPLNFNRTFDLASLASDQSVLLFHTAGDQLHILFANQNEILHHSIGDATKYRETTRLYSTFCQSENVGFGESLETLNLGANLYKDLIGWLNPEVLQASARIAIIESSPIERIPFAALLTEASAQDARGFRDLHFAAEKHAFSYHQSPSSFFEAQQKNHYANQINLTALAPSQLSSESIASTNSETANTLGLVYATQEVEKLVKKFTGTLLTGQQANFDGFLSAFDKSNVIHIASHASSNHTDGEFSYIVITDTAMLSGKRLYARTLSEHELTADLVVLAACESGSGKLKRGEGTMSLSNVFLTAGAQSVLHTGWRVEDKRSQEVLLKFYDELNNKQPLDQALVKAQRNYLQTAGGQYLHPFYWSAFAVSGNMTAIDSDWSKFFYLGIPAMLLLFSFLYCKRR